MRVLILTTWFPSLQAPAQAPFNLLHAQAVAAHQDVTVVHVRLGGRGAVSQATVGGLPVTSVPLRIQSPGSYWHLFRTVWRAVRDAEVLHTMAFSAALVAVTLPGWRRLNWVHTEHWSGMTSPETVSPLWVKLAWLRYLLRLPDKVTAVSNAQAEGLRRFVRRGHLSVIPNVIPFAGLRNRVPEAEAAAEAVAVAAAGAGAGTDAKTETGPGVLRLVAVGGLTAGKRPVTAVETVAWLHANGHKAQLTWVGDGPERESVQASIKSHGLGEWVKITGRVPHASIEGYLRGADVFLLPTAHETFCVSAAEAVAVGLPVVMTDLPAVRDFLTPQNSVLVRDPSAGAFGHAVVLALETFRNASAAGIAETIRDRFSPAAVAHQFAELYAEL